MGQEQATLFETLSTSWDEQSEEEPAGQESVEQTPAEQEPVEQESPLEGDQDLPTKQEDVASRKEKDPSERPSSWSKETGGLWDKLQSGTPLSNEERVQLQRQIHKREADFASGVHQYKTQADQYKAQVEETRVLKEAIAPFMGELQAAGIHPATWVQNLGHAHMTLVKGTDQQRLDMFVKLVNDYKVPLQALLGGQEPDQQVLEYNRQLQRLRQQTEQQYQDLNGWRQQQETIAVQNEVQRFMSDPSNVYASDDDVKLEMARLLEHKVAVNLPDAYKMAIRLVDRVVNLENEKLRSSVQAGSVVTRAKSAAVSPKSVSPRGSPAPNNDLRSTLSDAWDGTDKV